MISRTKCIVATVAVLGAMAGCDDATAPAAAGRVEVEAVGDRDGASSDTGGTPTSGSDTTSSAEGTIDFSARVYARAGTDGWVELTGGAAQAASVDASGASSVSVVTADAGARSYTRVRVVFEELRANVTGGVEVGAGEALEGEIRMGADGSSEPAIVEREVDLRVREGAAARLVIDLNADAWLSRADPETGTVARSEVESAVRVFAGG